VAALLVLPLTAVLHHLVFFPGMCLLNEIGPDYDAATVLAWLRQDPSLYVAVVLATVIYAIGRAVPAIEAPTKAVLIAFLPLSIWIWDVPFSGRHVCELLHDGRSAIRTRHLYVAGIATTPFLVIMLRRSSK
jgi:hypothetical protein